jgi:DNA-binding beta-propeller fold protein YncE
LWLVIGLVLGITSESLAFQSGVSPEFLRSQTILSGLQNPQAIDATDLGKIYVAESGKSRLLVVDTTGARIDSMGNLGFGDYQLDQPVDIDATNGLKIYIADQGNRRIQVYDRRLQYLTTIQPLSSSTEQPYEPLKMASNTFQEVFFFNGTTRHVVKINERGEEANAFGLNGIPFEQRPRDLDANEEWVYVLDHNGNQLHRFSTGGSYVSFWALQNPALALIWYRNAIWTLHKSEIRQFNTSGRLVARYRFEVELQPIDFARVGSTTYMLTAESIIKLY